MTQPQIKINALAIHTILELSVAGGSNVTLTAAQANNGILRFTGLLTANINVIVPNGPRQYNVINNTTGAFTLTVKTLAGTGALIPQSGVLAVVADGTNVISADGPTAGGSPTYVQYNNSGAFAGSAKFAWVDASTKLQLGTSGGSPVTAFVKTPDASSGTVADLVIATGDATSTTACGSVFLRAGDSDSGTAGSATVAGGASTTVTTAGSATIRGGTNISTGAGGDVSVNGGSSGGSATGGAVNITAGSAGTTGLGGDVTISAGSGGSTSGNGGAMLIRGGLPVDGNGGAVALTGRNGVGTNRSGGAVTITAGTKTGSGADGVINLVIPATGALHINGAAGTAGYALTSNGAAVAPTWQAITASTATNLAGGATNQIPYQSAASTTAFSSKFTWANSTNVLTVGPANGGSATIRTPVGGAGEDGTSLTVQAGDSTDASTGSGNLTLNAGAGSATIAGGDVTIAGGVSGGSGSGIILFQAGGTTRVQINSGSLSSSVLMGYRAGSGVGGAVTQATSRTTGVTLNKASGAITLVSAAGSTTPATFTVTNSVVTATDVIIVNQKSGTDLYHLLVTNIASGSFQITAFTTGGTTTEQPVINFAVITGSAN
jgi:hypothetical protein